MKLLDEIASWFRNPKLGVPHAILFGALIIALATLIGAAFFNQSVWIALGALGTCLAVLVALFGESYWRHRRRPILEMRRPGYSPEYLRRARMITTDESGVPIQLNGLEEKRCYVDIQLQNIGKTIAKNCQPLLTRVWQKQGNEWKEVPQWVPIGLDWILDELKRSATHMPTEEKNIVPRKPYIFNLGYVSDQKPEKFCLARYLIPTGQPEDFRSGTNCFEITIFAENADTVRKYFTVQFEPGWDKDMETIMQGIKVSASDQPPL